MHSEYNDIWLAIVEADLPNATKSVGMDLSQWADKNTGQVNLSMELFLVICGGITEQAAKRHLTRLKKAGIIHFSTKSDGDVNVFITFLNWVLIPEEELGLEAFLRQREEEENDPQISQMTQIEEDTGASHFPKCVAPHDGGTSEGDRTEDARHSPSATHQVAPHTGPDRAAILSEQVEALQRQVGQLQGTIGLLCQRFGVEIEIEAKVEDEVKRGEPRVGFGALTQGDAPDLARGRAEIGAKRDSFLREGGQQTNVCLLVNTPSIPKDLNKPTDLVIENAQKLARELSGASHFPKCVAPHDDGASESDGVQDARHRLGATHQSKSQKSAESAKSAEQTSSSSPKIPLDEQDCTFKLLTDPEIGVSHREARKFAQSRSFEYVRCQVFAWQKEMGLGKVDGVGALVNRIRCNFGAPEPSKAQQESGLYQRHRTAFEIETEEKVKEELRAQMAERDAALSQPQPQSQPIPLEPVDPAIWQQTLGLLQKDFRGSPIFDRYVAPTRLLGVHEGVYVISVINQEMLDQASQRKGVLRRHLGQVMGDPNVKIRLEITRMSRKKGIFRAGAFVGSLAQVYGPHWDVR